jgi:hypothetical protein
VARRLGDGRVRRQDASTSAGATFSPPVTIVSESRPVTVRRPRSSIGRGSPCAGRARGRGDRRAGDEDLALRVSRTRVQNSGTPCVATCEQASVNP